jgi:2-keto-4-pentenoate hydratase
MSTFDPAPAAAFIASAMNERRRFDFLPEAQRPRTIPEGYDVQDRIAADCGKPGGLEDRTAGWKLGFGSANAMKGAGIDRPLIGRMFASRLTKDGAAVAAPAGALALIEIEIAFTLARDVAPTETIASPLDVVAQSNLVSEIVLSRYIDRSKVGLPSFAADSVGFHALVIGPKVEPASIASIARSLTVSLDGRQVGSGLTGDDSLDPVNMLAALMRHARDRGITLKKGEIVTSGTLTKPFDAPVPAAIAAKSDGGGVQFTLKAG